jgi:CHAD domain-containing protein
MGTTATAVRETERKYEADEATELPEPAGLLGLAACGEPEDQRLEATYFDTDDLRLLRAKVTLRRRVGGDDDGWHLKVPSGEDSREEIRLPLSRADRRTPPAELVELTRVHRRRAALKPVAELITRRRRWVLADDTGRQLVEVVDDQVSAHTMGRETTASSWREIEVELAEHGQPELLDTIEQRLRKIGIRRAGSSSKLGRVLEPRLRTSREPVSKRVKAGSAAEAVLDYLGDQLAAIRAQDPLVRQDAPDALHQMRVAARRARSALQAFRTVLSREATRELIEELKWLGNELSEARDSEVIEERLLRVTHELSDELVLGPVASQITRSVQRRRADGQRQALVTLDSERYLALQDSFEQLLAHPPLTKRARRKAGPVMVKTIDRVWRRLKKRKRAADAAAPGHELDSALHETRKMAKRLRYTAEVAEPVLGQAITKLRRRAKAVHKVLGEHQDAVVARPQIRALAADMHQAGHNGFTYGLLYAAEKTRADQAEREFPAAWRKLAKSAKARL